MQRLRLIHWKTEEAKPRITQLENLGYKVEYTSLDAQELRIIRQYPPDIIVIDLTRSPSQGRDIGLNLRKYKSTRFIPLVFAGGASQKVVRVKGMLPDATFSDWEGIGIAIKESMDNPPSDPIVPESVFAAYSSTPLPKKFGIKPGARVILVNPPENFEGTLGELPQGVTLAYKLQNGDVHLWFTTSRADLSAGIDKIGALTITGPLWIIWPKKSSNLAGDLTQNIVRQTGLDNGLVDYKICSVDETWSGLCFTRRKSE